METTNEGWLVMQVEEGGVRVYRMTFYPERYLRQLATKLVSASRRAEALGLKDMVWCIDMYSYNSVTTYQPRRSTSPNLKVRRRGGPSPPTKLHYLFPFIPQASEYFVNPVSCSYLI